MKKVLMLIFIVLMSVSMYGQHLKFMGVPIDGNINTFAAKMAAKGFSVSPRNKYAGVGIRLMRGIFFDQNVELWISYTPETKTVYRVRVEFWNENKDVCESYMKEIESVIKDKYIYVYDESKTKGGDDIDVYTIYPDVGSLSLGDIYIGIHDASSLYGYGYNLNLTYEDEINTDKNDSRKIDDI